MVVRDRRFLSIFLNEPVYVVEESAQPGEDIRSLAAIQYKGQNKKEVLIIVQDEKAEYLSEYDEVFLIKILQAVQLTQNDIALVNIYGLQNQAQQFTALNNISFKTLISFGDIPEVFPFRKYLKKYQWNQDGENRVYLLADILKDIANDRTKKQLLWKNLQEIFH